MRKHNPIPLLSKINFKSSSSILRLSLPIMLAQLGNVLLGLTDTVMLGRLGKAELAAVGLSNQIFFLIAVIGMGIMTALTPLTASSNGAENKKECGEFLRSGIELSMIISCIVFVVVVLIAINFDMFLQTAAVNGIASKYLRILGVSTFPMLLFLAMKHYSDGLAYSRPAMVITLIGVLLNILLNWVFIFGKLTFPAMGATGAAISTLMVRMLMALLMVLSIFRSERIKQYLPPLVSTYRTRPIIVKLLRMGFPTGLQIFFEVAAYATITIIAGWISLTALAAHQIGMGLIAFCYMVATGFCVAGSIKVGQAFGKGNKEAIAKEGLNSMGTSMFFMVITSLMLIVFRSQILAIFSKEADVLDDAMNIFLVIVAFQMINGLQATIIGILRGMHDVNMPAKFTLVAYWCVAIPFAYLLVKLFGLELKGIWISMLAGLCLSFCLLIIRFYRIMQKGEVKDYKAETLEHAQ